MHARSRNPTPEDVSHADGHHQGAGDLSRPVRRRRRRRSTRSTRSASWAAGLGYKGVQIPTWDGRLFDLEKAAESQDLLRRGEGHGRPARPRDHRAVARISRASSSPSIRPTTRPSTASPRPRCAAIPRRAQEWAVEQLKLRRQGLAQSRPQRARHLLRRARLALSSIPWPQRPAGPGRGRPSTSWPRAGGRSSTPSTRPASTSATRSIPARTCTTAPPSRCSSSASTTTRACNMLYDPSPLRAAGARLSRHSSTSTTSGSRRSTSRTRSSIRPAGRASMAAIQPGSNRAGRFRSLGDGQVDFARHLLQARRSTTIDGWAVLEWECCLKHPEDGAREGAPSSSQPHHPRDREGLRRFRRRRHRSGGQPRDARHRLRKDSHGGRGTQRRERRQTHPLGMVGGGKGAFIGAVHRIAARIDDSYELVAGALSVDARSGQGVRRRARPRARAHLRLATRRWREKEAARPDGIEAVVDRHAQPSCTSGRARRSSRPASTSSATSR